MEIRPGHQAQWKHHPVYGDAVNCHLPGGAFLDWPMVCPQRSLGNGLSQHPRGAIREIPLGDRSCRAMYSLPDTQWRIPHRDLLPVHFSFSALGIYENCGLFTKGFTGVSVSIMYIPGNLLEHTKGIVTGGYLPVGPKGGSPYSLYDSPVTCYVFYLIYAFLLLGSPPGFKNQKALPKDSSPRVATVFTTQRRFSWLCCTRTVQPTCR